MSVFREPLHINTKTSLVRIEVNTNVGTGFHVPVGKHLNVLSLLQRHEAVVTLIRKNDAVLSSVVLVAFVSICMKCMRLLSEQHLREI
jgi:hypothetical protein